MLRELIGCEVGGGSGEEGCEELGTGVELAHFVNGFVVVGDEMEALGPMKLADVLEAQKGMIAVARGLVKDGTIQMPSKGGDDDYV